MKLLVPRNSRKQSLKKTTKFHKLRQNIGCGLQLKPFVLCTFKSNGDGHCTNTAQKNTTKHTKRKVKLKQGSEWFPHEANQTMCMSSNLGTILF